MHASTHDSFLPCIRARQQRGSVLLISLVILSILSVLGLQSMSTSILEERMASNERESQEAFQGAESALRLAEEWVDARLTRPTPCDGAEGSASFGMISQDSDSTDDTAESNSYSYACSLWESGSLDDDDNDQVDFLDNLNVGDWWSEFAQAYSSSDDYSPRYFIEQVCLDDACGGREDSTTTNTSLVVGSGQSLSDNATIYFYRITARGVGPGGTATVVLQSHFAKGFQE